jgi:chromosome segregation ATPase
LKIEKAAAKGVVQTADEAIEANRLSQIYALEKITKLTKKIAELEANEQRTRREEKELEDKKQDLEDTTAALTDATQETTVLKNNLRYAKAVLKVADDKIDAAIKKGDDLREKVEGQ